MNIQLSSDRDLITTLGTGRTGADAGLARELILRWGRRLDAVVEMLEDGDHPRFATHLHGIYLTGLQDPPCLVIVDGEAAAASALRTVVEHAAKEESLAIILALNDVALELTRQKLPPGRAVVLDAASLTRLMEASDPLAVLAEAARSQISRRKLIPYQFLRPVSGTIFFGRGEILDQLLHREQTSFVIAGPGGIGKSSILAQYQHVLRRQRDPRLHRLVAINFKGIEATTADAVARRVAMAVSPSSRTYYDNTVLQHLPRILQQQFVRLDGPLEFLFDEVDEVCQTEVFTILGEAARQGQCRLVLCGRGVLLRLMSSPDSPLMRRLQLLRIPPLPNGIARDLIRFPLRDLGLPLDREQEVVQEMLRITGRLPHALQFLLSKLTNYCLDTTREVIGRPELDAVTQDFESAQFFTAPLRGIRDERCHRLAVLILRELKSEFTVPDVCRLAMREQIQLTEWQAFEICSELLVNNILAWAHGGCFRVASGALLDFAGRLGVLTDAKRQREKLQVGS